MESIESVREWIVVNKMCIHEIGEIKLFVKEFVKNHPITRKQHFLLSILIRCSMNLTSNAILTKFLVIQKKPSYLKLSIGILLRNCFMDLLLGLYICDMDDEHVEEIAEVLNLNYVKALFEQFEVYRDKIEDVHFDEDFLEHMYTMSIEDNYLQYLEPYKKPIAIETGHERDLWKVASKKNIRTLIAKDKINQELNLKTIYEYLLRKNEYSEYVKNIFGYYKYYSQYEHFSESGFGNAIAPNDSDNVDMTKAIARLSEAITKVKQKMSS